MKRVLPLLSVLGLVFVMVSLVCAPQARAEKKAPLVIMPLKVEGVDKSMLAAMETALVQGLQDRYEVYSGENVAKKAREIFLRESRTARTECDETKCMQDIAIAFQAELIAVASVTKRTDGFFIALSIRNIMDEKTVYSNALPCKGCDEYQVVDTLKLLAGGSAGTPSRAGATPSSPAVSSAGPSGTEPEPLKKPASPAPDGFVFVKGGCYQMGDTFGDSGGFFGSNEKPVHEVCVDDFYMAKYLVTQKQWKEVMGDNPVTQKKRKKVKGDNPSRFQNCADCPVEEVSWADAQGFISRLNKNSGRNYRLPTEAEWEYAARSGGKKERYSGTSDGADLSDYAWFDANSGNKTHPVGELKPNGLGLYDMSGNVWEWVKDIYDGSYYSNSPKNNPKGPSEGSEHVLRGGSWYSDPRGTRASFRYGNYPGLGSGGVGFRLALPAQ